MLRKIVVRADLSGVLPTAPFSNLRPGFSAEMEFELESDNEEVFKDVIRTQHQSLQGLCHEAFELEAERARIQKVENDLKNCRFYTTETGEKYISVTSFLNYDKDFHVSDEELRQYAAQGTIIDWEVRNFVKTGKWVESKDEPSLAAERFIIKSGKLQLALGGWNFLGFLEKYPIKNLKSCEKPVFNDQFRYAGTPDLEGVYEGLPTLISIKRTKSETDNFVQDSSYSKCKGMEHIKQILVCELKSPDDGGNKQGYSKPSVTQDIDRYFELAKYKRSEFKKIYGV